MTRRVVLVSAAFLAVFGVPTLARAGNSPANSLIGGGIVQFACGPTCNLPSVQAFGITGRPTLSNPDSARGQFELGFNIPGVGEVQAHVDVTCLDVVANPDGGLNAGVAGHIVTTNIPGFNEGDVVHVQAYDGRDTGNPDRVAGDNFPPKPENSCVADPSRFVSNDPHYAVLAGSISIASG
ncbi:MAG: hypothetical protein JWO37_3025 [Acidimicrobiales bacterium]|nr:hypothetical protein [Acidimicrobiales bacterium]